MLFFFRTGEWNYTTFAESTSQLTEENAQRLRTRYENWMKELGLLPDEVQFSVQNGDTLRWDVISDKGIPAEAEAFQQGSVMMQFDEAGSLSSFTYLINSSKHATILGLSLLENPIT